MRRKSKIKRGKCVFSQKPAPCSTGSLLAEAELVEPSLEKRSSLLVPVLMLVRALNVGCVSEFFYHTRKAYPSSRDSSKLVS